MLKKAFLLFLLLPVLGSSFAQTTFLPLRSENYHTLDRLETMSGRLCDSIANGDKPEARRTAVKFLQKVQADSTQKLGKIDRYNLEQMISESGEWMPNEDGAINSKRSWFNTFYKKQYNFAYVKPEGFLFDKNFFVVVNPVGSGMVLMQNNNPTPAGVDKMLMTNSQGAELRGWIAKKVGFYTSIVDNQEQYPYPVLNNVSKKLMAVPGADYFKQPQKINGRYDYMQASGYINFDVVKNHINVAFGSGKHFIGDGMSSLFLTDNSSNMPFLRIQTRIWHVNYECLYLELIPQYDKLLGDRVNSKKYSTIHYLSWNVSRNFTLGLFESEVFARPNSYEISYLNPIIFTTAINRFNGSGDKSLLGINVKGIIARHVQLYGQLAFNEFRIKELTGGNGWYGNKFGIQAGAKYFDAFTIKNLDLQAEMMMVRPYMYAASDTFTNYSNYNQPLADPLGSGFVKATGLLKYQPVKNLYLSLRGTYYIQGNDAGGRNFGNNIFNNYTTADHIYGVSLINGTRSSCKIISFNASYQIRRNLFIDAGGVYRNYTSESYNNNYATTGPVAGPLTTTYFYCGLRINTARREYDFF